MRAEDHKRLPLPLRAAHVCLATPCEKTGNDNQRLARDLGLTGPLDEKDVSAVCLLGCGRSQHTLVGSKDEAKQLRLNYLLAQPENQSLSSRELGKLAGVSHTAVQRQRKDPKTTGATTNKEKPSATT